ncbi:sodium channel subunit beta-4 [Eublepharis macularius]|uniref:Sodium channel subunit beta-4 n=1 Tax=Eublepharis macularius TaxID=481883 RepID=A0AA97LFL1_EUBMA|nr:sodium channel subunit beta-4 [Eublepharis macularius]
MAGGWLGAALLGLHLCSVTLALDVSVGKATTISTQNGSDVLLPCTFTACIGFENAEFSWWFNSTKLYAGTVRNKNSKPVCKHCNPRVELPEVTLHKDSREYNLSVILLSVDFSDSGKYTCVVKNPKEKGAEHNATLSLLVVVELEKVDKTLAKIIAAVVGGVIGLLILILLVKKLILFILKKKKEKNNECLVSSSGNDNTENGLAGSKADRKPAPKA